MGADDAQKRQIPEHLIRVLDGLAQEDDDLELDQAAASLTACIGKGRNIKETDAEAIFDLVPELLTILTTRAISTDGRLFHGRGDMSANLWCALYISQSLGDLMTFYPNLGETHFHPIFEVLEKLLTRADLMTESAKHVPAIAMRLLNLWSPQIASRPDQFARAVPTLSAYLEKQHAGLKFSASSLLEACHQYAPQALLAQTTHMIDALKDGSLVLSPALAHLYEIQPEAQDLFSQHVEWMLDIYEGRYAGMEGYTSSQAQAQRPALALLFRNMAKNNPMVLQPFVFRLVPSLKEPSTSAAVAECLHAMAVTNPSAQMGVIDHVKDALRLIEESAPECQEPLLQLMGVLGTSDSVTARDVASFMLAYSTSKVKMLKEASQEIEDLAMRNALAKDKKARLDGMIANFETIIPFTLQQIRVVAAAHPSCLQNQGSKLEPLLTHELKLVRQNAFFLSVVASGAGAGVLRCPRGGSEGTSVSRQAVFATIYCLKHAPWQFYYEVHKATRNMQMPLVLMQMRFDGKFGFFGGMVEEDETVEMTLQRELREELNYTAFEGFEYICSHEVPSEDMRTHLFAKEVNEEAFFEAEAAARKSQHYGAEVLGYVRAPLYVNESGKITRLCPSFTPLYLPTMQHACARVHTHETHKRKEEQDRRL